MYKIDRRGGGWVSKNRILGQTRGYKSVLKDNPQILSKFEIKSSPVSSV